MRSRYLALFTAVACSQAGEPCLAADCGIPTAFAITRTGSAAFTPLTTASYRILPSGSSVACDVGQAANVCALWGSSGTYQIEISAPSYTTVQRTIVVPAKPAARCECQLDDTQYLNIAMSPTS